MEFNIVMYTINLNNRPFEAIKYGKKKIEGRVPTSFDTVSYNDLRENDLLVFRNRESGESMIIKLLGIRHYKNVETMLLTEGVSRVLSSGSDISQGVINYNTFAEYEENIAKYGIFALEIEVQKNVDKYL